MTLARPIAGCGRMGDAAPAPPASGSQQNDSTPPQQPRKQSAFDVLLKSKKQSKAPQRTSLEAVQAAVKRSGGAFSPAASPSSKRIRTPTGVNSLRVYMWHLGFGMQQTVLSRAAIKRKLSCQNRVTAWHNRSLRMQHARCAGQTWRGHC